MTNKEKFNEIMTKYFGAPYPEGVNGCCKQGDVGGISFSGKWADAEYKEYKEIQHTTLNDLESEYKEKLTEEVKKVLKGPFIFDVSKNRAFCINEIDAFQVSTENNADGEIIYSVLASLIPHLRPLVLFTSENSDETKAFLEILLDEINNEIMRIYCDGSFLKRLYDYCCKATVDKR